MFTGATHNKVSLLHRSDIDTSTINCVTFELYCYEFLHYSFFSCGLDVTELPTEKKNI